MKKILLVVGARPQFVKLAPVIKVLKETTSFGLTIVHTGQHYDYMMSQVFFTELAIPEPNYNLEVGSGSQIFQISDILTKLTPVIQTEKPDMIMVFGDTNSTSAAALCGAVQQIPVAHVEAGLREFDKSIPEEINKLVTDALATLYFCPTPTGVKNLSNSGITDHVYLTGDVGLDLLFANRQKFSNPEQCLDKLNLSSKKYYFATCHRASNTNNTDNLKNILTAFGQLDYPVVFAVHPRTSKTLSENNLQHLINKNIILSEPLGFWDTQILIKNSKMVLTDSGGIIKEAYFHKVPSIIIDKQTEWVEIIDEAWAAIAGPSTENILKLMTNFETPLNHNQSLGHGRSAVKIAQIINEYFQHKK